MEEALKAFIEAQRVMNKQHVDMNRVLATKLGQSQSEKREMIAEHSIQAAKEEDKGFGEVTARFREATEKWQRQMEVDRVQMRESLEAQKVQLQRLRSTENNVGSKSSRVMNPNCVLKKMTAQDDAETYLLNFEKIATREGWPKQHWATVLGPYLCGEAQEVYGVLPEEMATNYCTLKEEILDRLAVKRVQRLPSWDFFFNRQAIYHCPSLRYKVPVKGRQAKPVLAAERVPAESERVPAESERVPAESERVPEREPAETEREPEREPAETEREPAETAYPAKETAERTRENTDDPKEVAESRKEVTESRKEVAESRKEVAESPKEVAERTREPAGADRMALEEEKQSFLRLQRQAQVKVRPEYIPEWRRKPASEDYRVSYRNEKLMPIWEQRKRPPKPKLNESEVWERPHSVKKENIPPFRQKPRRIRLLTLDGEDRDKEASKGDQLESVAMQVYDVNTLEKTVPEAKQKESNKYSKKQTEQAKELQLSKNRNKLETEIIVEEAVLQLEESPAATDEATPVPEESDRAKSVEEQKHVDYILQVVAKLPVEASIDTINNTKVKENISVPVTISLQDSGCVLESIESADHAQARDTEDMGQPSICKHGSKSLVEECLISTAPQLLESTLEKAETVQSVVDIFGTNTEDFEIICTTKNVPSRDEKLSEIIPADGHEEEFTYSMEEAAKEVAAESIHDFFKHQPGPSCEGKAMQLMKSTQYQPCSVESKMDISDTKEIKTSDSAPAEECKVDANNSIQASQACTGEVLEETKDGRSEPARSTDEPQMALLTVDSADHVDKPESSPKPVSEDKDPTYEIQQEIPEPLLGSQIVEETSKCPVPTPHKAKLSKLEKLCALGVILSLKPCWCPDVGSFVKLDKPKQNKELEAWKARFLKHSLHKAKPVIERKVNINIVRKGTTVDGKEELKADVVSVIVSAETTDERIQKKPVEKLPLLKAKLQEAMKQHHTEVRQKRQAMFKLENEDGCEVEDDEGNTETVEDLLGVENNEEIGNNGGFEVSTTDIVISVPRHVTTESTIMLFKDSSRKMRDSLLPDKVYAREGYKRTSKIERRWICRWPLNSSLLPQCGRHRRGMVGWAKSS